MLLDLYLWLWPRMNLRYVLRRCGYLAGLAVLVLGPLLYVNVDLIRQGFKPSQAGLHVGADQAGQNPEAYYLPDEE